MSRFTLVDFQIMNMPQSGLFAILGIGKWFIKVLIENVLHSSQVMNLSLDLYYKISWLQSLQYAICNRTQALGLGAAL